MMNELDDKLADGAAEGAAKAKEEALAKAREAAWLYACSWWLRQDLQTFFYKSLYSTDYARA